MSIRDNLGSGSNGSVLDSLEEIEANTTPGKSAGALAVKELNQSLTLDYSNASTDVQDVNTLLQKLLDRFYPAVYSLIPIMTSNTLPYGTASASSFLGAGVEAYKAFTGAGNAWRSDNGSTTQWISYTFRKKVQLTNISFEASTESAFKINSLKLYFLIGGGWSLYDTISNIVSYDYNKAYDRVEVEGIKLEYTLNATNTTALLYNCVCMGCEVD